NPLVEYSDIPNSLAGTAVMKEMSLSGRYVPQKGMPEDLSFIVDSMSVTGCFRDGSLAFGLDRLELAGEGEAYSLALASSVDMVSGGTKKLSIPLGLEAGLFPDAGRKVHQIKGLKASVASLDIEGEALVDLSGDHPCFTADAAIDRESLAEIKDYLTGLYPELKQLRTDARISTRVHLEGLLEDTARILTEVEDFRFTAGGLRLNLSGKSDNILEEDPKFEIEGNLHAALDSLASYLPDSLEVTASGKLDGKVGGSFRLSELDPFNFSGIGLECELRSNGIDITERRDSITAHLGSTVATVGKGPDAKTRISARVDSLFAEYGTSTFIRGTGIHLFAHNTDEAVDGAESNHPLHGHLEIGSAGMMDMDLNFVGVKSSENVFQIRRHVRDGRNVPHLNLSTDNERIIIRADANRISADGLSMEVNANPAKPRARTRRRDLPPALQDSLKQEINIQLGESVMKYYRNWDLDGAIHMNGCSVITPHFPLENRITGLEGRFNNDRIDLSGVRFESGTSDISATGSVSGIRRALSPRHGKLILSLDLNSDFIDLNQIFTALAAGEKFRETEKAGLATGGSDSEYLTSIQQQAAEDTLAQSAALIIPAGVEARFTVNASTLKYSEMETSWFSSDIIMKDRCLQLTNALAMTNMGDVFLEGFYSSRSKDDLKAGFDFTLSNVTAEKVISLFPAVDSIMPMLQAFNGLLDCEIAATASIDSSMSLIMPSISGIVKIDGKDLSLADSESLNKLRKTLMFKDKDSSYIDNMSIRGIVRDNLLEIFPFIMKVDRYTVAIDGKQQFDQNFRYHLSAIKSPIPMRFGVNLNGNFEDWKWRIGKARYKSTKIPLFDNEVDDLRHNLMTAIHTIFDKGVDDALRSNEASQEAIENKKTEIEYAAGDTGELNEAEKTLWETLRNSLPEGRKSKGFEN
ncbi:MAG: hypothetical protein ACI4TJ_01585, partial [Candidatus Cryptobacteroides sp.]